jgi:hypothetical protein
MKNLAFGVLGWELWLGCALEILRKGVAHPSGEHLSDTRIQRGKNEFESFFQERFFSKDMG